VLGAVEMFGGVLVFGRVAAADVAALHAKAQVNPGVARLETFLATFGVWSDFMNVALMRASGHKLLPMGTVVSGRMKLGNGNCSPFVAATLHSAQKQESREVLRVLPGKQGLILRNLLYLECSIC